MKHHKERWILLRNSASHVCLNRCVNFGLIFQKNISIAIAKFRYYHDNLAKDFYILPAICESSRGREISCSSACNR